MKQVKYTQELLLALQNQEFSVIAFQAGIYSPIFFMQLFDVMKSQYQIDIKLIDMQSGDFAYKSQLATSFLGLECVYWLGDITVLKAKQKDDVIDYLAHYQGPHKVIVFIDEKIKIDSNQSLIKINYQDKYFYQDTKNLWVHQDSKQSTKISFFLHEIYKIKNNFTLDELCLLKKYQDVIAGNAQEFYTSWVMRLVNPETSLFTLSQLLFEKKEAAFFKLWLVIKPLYADMFWIAFWSDQLYKAYFFIAFTQEENFAAVKQVSYGLPFSFMKQSYKQYQLDEIQRFHQAFYTIDTALKNGGHSYQIDQVYVDFFAGSFKK